MSGLVVLPPVSGNGYYSYSPTLQQFGTPETISTIIQICQDYFRNQFIVIGIGDISYADGRKFPPHGTHRDGRAVDIRPISKNRNSIPVRIGTPNYDRDATALLAASLIAHRNVQRILFNDTTISGVKYYDGHDNHLHVMMKS